jgi:hypothetical protein
MTPTARLRFVERVVPAPEHGEGIGKKVRILQQWWEDRNSDIHWINGNPGEWRDIALEEEK